MLGTPKLYEISILKKWKSDFVGLFKVNIYIF
jgi:hypothetical protein